MAGSVGGCRIQRKPVLVTLFIKQLAVLEGRFHKSGYKCYILLEGS